MPLQLTTPQQAALGVLTCLRSLRGAYELGSRHLDSVIGGLLSLNDADLASIGNEMGPEQMQNLLGAHAQQVAGCNALAVGTDMIIAALTGSPPAGTRLASSATLTERLAEQRRTLHFDGVTFSVTTEPLPPPPEVVSQRPTLVTSLLTGVVGLPMQLKLANSLGASAIYAVGPLPVGLTFDGGDLISGTPTEIGEYPVLVDIKTELASSGPQTLLVTVVAEKPVSGGAPLAASESTPT